MKQSFYKRFRFGLRTLLCLPVLFACVWWWTSWPDRTSHRFVKLLNEGKVDAAQAMLVPAPEADDDAESLRLLDVGAVRITPFQRSPVQARSFSDLASAEGDFTISQDDGDLKRYSHYGLFRAIRGRIRPPAKGDSSALLTVYRLQSDAEQILGHLRTNSSPNNAMQMIVREEGDIVVFSTHEGHEELRKLLKALDQPEGP
jgi:hypothetical protein